MLLTTWIDENALFWMHENSDASGQYLCANNNNNDVEELDWLEVNVFGNICFGL